MTPLSARGLQASRRWAFQTFDTSTRISLGPRFPFSTVSSWSGRPLARQRDLGYRTPGSLNPVSQMKQDRGNYASRGGSVSLQPQFGADHPPHPLGPQHLPPLPAPGLHFYAMLSWSDSGIVFSSPLCGLLGDISSSSP